MRRLDRYFIQEILGPLGLGFLVYTFILLLRFLFQSAEMIIRRGLPLSIVGELLLKTLPNIVVLTIPMSLLFGVLIAVGRLASDSELVAMRSMGISLLSLYRPILMLSGALALANLLVTVYALPKGNHGLQQLRLDIVRQSMSQQVEPRIFYEEWTDKVVYVFEMPEGEPWKGVFLAESLPGTKNQLTTARTGEIKFDESGERLLLEMKDAYTHVVNLADPSDYQIYYNKELRRVLESEFSSTQRQKVSISKGLRELSLDELQGQARDASLPPEHRNLARVELHKKFSIPVACLVFGLVALPLGFNNRRGSKASGFALSIGVLLFYYILMINGEEAARFGKISPWLAMWLPNITLGVMGVFLLVRRNRDKSLLLSRIDRWIRSDVWSGLLHLERLRRVRRSRKQRRLRQRGESASPRTDLVVRLPRLRLAFPNLLDRYVLGLFTRMLLLVGVSGLVIFILADLTQTMDDILENEIARSVVLDYYKYMSLQILFELAPIVVLVTTLITFSLLSRSNEVTACKALGIGLYRLSVPAVMAAALVTLLCAFLQSEVLPASNLRVAQLKDEIKGREAPRTYRPVDRHWLFGQGRYAYHYLRFDPKEEKLQRLQVFVFDDDHRLVQRLVTTSATYAGDGWVFADGWTRTFNGREVSKYERFARPTWVDYPEKPEYFAAEIRPPDQMTYLELKDYIQELRDSGQKVPELEVELHNKIAYPAVSLIMALVGLPFAFRLGRQGALYGVGLSIVLGMVFMGVVAVFTTLGETGALPALVAVWSPNLVFALFSLYLFLGVHS